MVVRATAVETMILDWLAAQRASTHANPGHTAGTVHSHATAPPHR